MRKIIVILILSISFGISGCDKWLTVQPATMVTPEDLYSTPGGYKDVLIGCYQLMGKLYHYSGSMTTGEIEDLARAWEVKNDSPGDKLGRHEYDDDVVDEEMGKIFKDTYKVIANLSELIKALESQDGILTEKMYSNYLGEALGLRAFLHLELMRIWGPMPSTIRPEKKYLPFVEGIQISPYEYLTYSSYMDLVKRDLDRAEQLLKKDIINIWNPQNEYMNYYAVLAIQARYHFWNGNKAKALDYGNRLLVADTLTQFPLYDASLGGGNNENKTQTAFLSESIWKYHFNSKNSVSLYKYNFYSYVIGELFENNSSDSRLNQWRMDPIVDGEKENRMMLTKFDVEKDPNAGVDDLVSGYVPLIRISEIYLMLMELESLERANELYAEFAKARLISPLSFASKEELTKYIQVEYRREFIGEGQMFFAYKRWGTVRMPRKDRGCGESTYVPPIPKKEFDLTN